MRRADTKPTRAKILVVDDHVVVRDGLVALIKREPDLRVCGATGSAREALALAARQKPDLVIVDLVLREGDGLELIKDLHALDPRLRCLVISMQDEGIYAERCLQAGARGYLMKSCATEEFLDAIRAVLAGDVCISPKMNARILNGFINHREPTPAAGPEHLTDRELEVFTLIGSGLTTREAARRLGISIKTVETHRENIKMKLGLDNATTLIREAAAWFERHGSGARPPVP